MKVFSTLTGIVVPMDRSNVDTDQIIPKQFLKSIRRTGFADNLFDAWRYLDEGDLKKNPNERLLNLDFVLNQERFQDAKILLARENFGCGSSREHAVWALEEYGIRCLIAPSFSDIFYNNCFKNSVLPVFLDEETVSGLFELLEKTPGFSITVNLEQQRVEWSDGEQLQCRQFEIDAFYKHCLLLGLDDIKATLEYADDIRAYEAKRKQQAPWLFVDLSETPDQSR